MVEESRDGWFNVSPVEVSVGTQTSGFDVNDVDFANTEYGSIEGTKFVDSDGDLSTTEDQEGLEGWKIQLLDENQALVEETETDGNGDYSFDNLAPGTYFVREETRDGWTALSQVTVAVGAQTSGFEVNDVDFYNFELMDLSGFKWGDFDGDSAWDANESGLEGWTIVIDFDDNPDNGYFLSTITNTDGSYAFTGLGPNTFGDDGITTLADDSDGVLYVYEFEQDGFAQTFDGGYTFTLTSGLLVAGPEGIADEGNFGNQMLDGANRTPGFWQSTLGYSLYNGNNSDNGDANGDGVPDGDKDFDAEGWSTTDLLTKYGIDLEGNDGVKDTFILWDADGDREYDAGDDIFLTVAELHDWVGGGEKGGGRDFLGALERDLGATFLNTVNNHSLTTPESDSEPSSTGYTAVDGEIYDSYLAAVQFILEWDADLDGEAKGSKKQQQDDWKAYGSDAHTELSAYNENGEAIIDGAAVQIAMDGDDYSSSLVQGYLQTQQEMLLMEANVLLPPIESTDPMMMYAETNMVA